MLPALPSDRRLAPLGNTFKNFEEQLWDASNPGAPRPRRRHSYAGYPTHDLLATFRGACGEGRRNTQEGSTAASVADGIADSADAKSELSAETDLCGTHAPCSSCSTLDWTSADLQGTSDEAWPDTDSEDECPDAAYQGLLRAEPPRRPTAAPPCAAPERQPQPPGRVAVKLQDHLLGQKTSQQQEAASATDPNVTTLMIRNLPKALVQQDLLDELDSTGFAGLYDFCYMPRSFSNGENLGFAFVNFGSAKVAGALVGSWHRQHKFGAGHHEASLNLSPASVQGLEKNLAKWDAPRLRRIRNPDYLPFVRRCGEEEAAALAAAEPALPAPTVPKETSGARQRAGPIGAPRYWPAGAQQAPAASSSPRRRR